jgi:hypothetical protein
MRVTVSGVRSYVVNFWGQASLAPRIRHWRAVSDNSKLLRLTYGLNKNQVLKLQLETFHSCYQRSDIYRPDSHRVKE